MLRAQPLLYNNKLNITFTAIVYYFRAYERGETTADFGYEALANGRLIRRRGTDIRTGGIDNKGWRK